MRQLIIGLMAGSLIALPAVAQDRERDRPRDQGSERSERSRGDRAEARRDMMSERAERPQRVERAAPADQPLRSLRAERGGRSDRATGGDVQIRERRDLADGRRGGDSRWDGVRGDGTTRSRAEGRPTRWNDREVLMPPSASGTTATARSGDEHRRYRSGDGRRWSSDWRSDRRYDWRSYRDRNRSVFRFGRYYDPYRYNYRRFSIGFSLWPNYYSSRYWLDDPWQYRLPPAYGPYRWVRYYDDALLVNIHTGQVVDVIHSFFW